MNLDPSGVCGVAEGNVGHDGGRRHRHGRDGKAKSWNEDAQGFNPKLTFHG